MHHLPRYVCVLAAYLFLVSFPANASGETLSGKVFGGGSPLPNTTVEALTDGTTAVAAQATTDAAGAYSLTLASGTYDLRVTPPSGSGFGQETIQNIELAVGVDRTYDVILLAAGNTALKGTVRGYGGQPVVNANVAAYTTNWQFIASTVTDTDGKYELGIGAGTIILQVSPGWPLPATPVTPTWFNRTQWNLEISGTTTFDIPLPVVKVSGTVTDADGLPLGGATVQVDTNSWDGTNQISLNGTSSVTTDGDGYYEVLALEGRANLTVRPPAGANATTLSETGLTLTGDVTRNIKLPAPTFLSGTVRGYGGQPVVNANVAAYTTNWQFIASTVTDTDGKYELGIGAGTIILQVSPGWPLPATPVTPIWFNRTQWNLEISGTTTFDIPLPVVKVSGTVTDADGLPLSGATVQVDTNSWDGTNQISLNGTSSATTDASGYYEVLALTGTANLTVRPPAGANATTLSETGLNLTGDVTRNIKLPAPTFLSGTVRGYGGQPVVNANVAAYTTNWQFIASTVTDTDGKYELGIGAGTIILQVSPGWPLPATLVAPTWFNRTQWNLEISGTTTFDIPLPVVKVSGTVTDSNGAPVANVSLQGNTNSWNGDTQVSLNGNTSSTTDAQGRYALLLFAGNSNLIVRPPASSGFTVTTLNGLTLTGDLTQRIILQRPDLSPPQIVAGPVVVHLSDTSVSISWTTNEAATSRVEYGIGSLTAVVNDSSLTTNHTVTLLGLAELSTYSFRVGSTDASGNGPTYSSVGTFATQGAPGDITPPVITGGPTVVFVDQTSAIVQWTTDEPASSTVDYGLTSALGASVSSVAGKFRQTHSMQLTGLSADTDYFAQVTSADPDGNSTSSSVFTFRTLAVPDTAAPVITAGPTVASVTDTKITIAWTTNEPATSGVSYNDGTEFFVVSDTALTKEHSITLSGLTPQTLYFITVSSTDAVGNGPTLGGPVEGTTSATPDTDAPVISNLRIEDVTETSAVVKWTTSEPASSGVNYGVVSQSPDNTKADVAAVTEHSLTLTGLQDGTQYYLTVSSTDASGNTGVSDEAGFKTISAFIDMPPSAPGPITAPAGPTNAASLSLSWGASTDDLGVTGYEILRNGEVIASVAADTTTFTDAAVPEGTVTYTVRATDTAGHTATSEPVTVIVDRTAPVVAVPADIATDAVGTAASVDFSASATDNLDGDVSVTCSPEAGSFVVGVTTVTCKALDAAGNEGTASFTVIVRDVTAPVVTVPDDIVLEATSAAGAAANFEVSAWDAVSANVTARCDAVSGTTFPIGATSVLCSAEDEAGNRGTAAFTITVRDTTAPEVTAVTPSETVLWSPDHRMVPLTLSIAVTDAADPAPACRIVGITSNEPVDGTGDGHTSPDWTFEGLDFAVRAERSGTGSGRVYTVTARCTDAAGNASTGTATVTVPKSQSKR